MKKNALFGPCALFLGATFSLATAAPQAPMAPGEVRVANLIYGTHQTSVCFADAFLGDIQRETPAQPQRRLVPVKMDDAEFFDYPFAVMTGEGKFHLTDAQRANLKAYLEHGGFLIASAGCSSKPWAESFRAEMTAIFPKTPLEQLKAEHPVFTLINDCRTSDRKHGATGLPTLLGLEMDGRLVLVFSPDGLNDSGNAGPNCCCCGGDELQAARKMNVNLMVYAMTH